MGNKILELIEDLSGDSQISTPYLLKMFEQAHSDLATRIEALKEDLKGDRK